MRTLTQYLARAPQTMCCAAHLFADHSNDSLPMVMVESDIGFLFVRLEGLSRAQATSPDCLYSTIREHTRFELVVTEPVEGTSPLTTVSFFAGFKGAAALHHLPLESHGPTVAALFVLLSHGGDRAAWDLHGPVVAQQATQALLGVMEGASRPFVSGAERILLNPSFTGAGDTGDKQTH